MTADEQFLLDRARHGQTDAFEELVRPHQDRLLKLALALSRNHEDAEDMLQDALVKAFKSLPCFRGECAFLTWLTRILLNVARNTFRRESRLRMRVKIFAQAGPATSGDPSERVTTEERRQFIRRALSVLPSCYRDMLVMFHYQGMSYTEIAAVLEMPVGTVRSRLAKGRKLLGLELEALGYPLNEADSVG